MTTYYVRTDGNNGNAGTTDSSGGAWLTIEYAASQVAAGDTVMVRASAGNAASYPTSSLDYNPASYFTPTAGSSAAGYVRWIGYNGVPTIAAPGLLFYASSYQHLENLYFVATADSFNMILHNSGGPFVVKNCVVNCNNYNVVGIKLGSPEGQILGGEVYGGTTSPTTQSGAYGIQFQSYGCLADGLKIRYTRDSGVDISVNGGCIRNCLIYGCVGDGVYSLQGATSWSEVFGCTINGNQGHGINIASSNGAIVSLIRNNCITNHTQSGKAGIYVATSGSDVRKAGWGWNNVWNNTSNYTNVSADSTDVSVDPGYANAANGDFTPSNILLRAAFPTAFASVLSKGWIGAIQVGGGGGVLIGGGLIR